MSPADEEAARQRGHDLVRLADRWGDVFHIGYNDGRLRAVHRRDGTEFRSDTARDLGQQLWQYMAGRGD